MAPLPRRIAAAIAMRAVAPCAAGTGSGARLSLLRIVGLNDALHGVQGCALSGNILQRVKS